MYGIEIEEWPARIAEVAMWLMDHQMNQRLSEEFGEYYVRLPLRSSPHIHHGNALRVNWNDVLPADECTHVLGNPPFVGKRFRTADRCYRSQPFPNERNRVEFLFKLFQQLTAPLLPTKKKRAKRR